MHLKTVFIWFYKSFNDDFLRKNESDKSHLLNAVEKAITGEEIERSDFCRYSPFFTVKWNELKYPDFSTEWINLSEAEKESVRKITGTPEGIAFEHFLLFTKKTPNSRK